MTIWKYLKWLFAKPERGRKKTVLSRKQKRVWLERHHSLCENCGHSPMVHTREDMDIEMDETMRYLK